MTNRVVCAGLFTLLMAACSTPESSTQQPAPETKAVQGPTIEFLSGFHPLERASDGSSWRWMGAEGAVRLKNLPRDMVLTVKGRAPGTVSQPPTIGFEFNGEPLEPIAGARGEVRKSFEIPAARQTNGEWSMLHITTTETFVPHDVNPQSPDHRNLGFAVYELTWEPK